MSDPLATTTLRNIPPDRYARIQQAARQDGIALSGNAGQAEDKGVAIAYAYDGASTLRISVLKVPSISIFGHTHDLISPQDVLEKVQSKIQAIQANSAPSGES